MLFGIITNLFGYIEISHAAVCAFFIKPGNIIIAHILQVLRGYAVYFLYDLFAVGHIGEVRIPSFINFQLKFACKHIGSAVLQVDIQANFRKKGQLVISHKKARALKSWDRVNEAFNNDEIVKGFVKTRMKGGMIVDVFGMEAFLAGSQIDIKPIRDYCAYVNQTMDFKIIKINPESRYVVVSHRALLVAEFIRNLEKGQILEGVVDDIADYGVFVDLGGIDGFIHINDLSWNRINHPEEVISLDEKIKIVVLDFNEQQKRIVLGLKQLIPIPWENFPTVEDENEEVDDENEEVINDNEEVDDDEDMDDDCPDRLVFTYGQLQCPHCIVQGSPHTLMVQQNALDVGSGSDMRSFIGYGYKGF